MARVTVTRAANKRTKLMSERDKRMEKECVLSASFNFALFRFFVLLFL